MSRPDCSRCRSVGWLLRRSDDGSEAARPCEECNAETYRRWLAGAYRSTNRSDKPPSEPRRLEFDEQVAS